MNTKRDKPVVEVDGFLMRQHKPSSNGMQMLCRCADVTKYQCRARGSSLTDSREVQMKTDHNGHLADPGLATDAGLMDVYRSAEVRPLLRSLWALAFLPPGDVVEAFDGLVLDSLQALVARDVIPQADVPRLNAFISDYFERTYIRRFNARGVLVDPLFPIATWNVHDAVLEDGARTNNSQEGWNRAFNQRFLRSKMKLSQFLLRLREEEEQVRQRIERARTHPAEAFRTRRRPKTIIRDGHIKAIVEEYDALPAVQRNRAAMADTLARIQHHLSA